MKHTSENITRINLYSISANRSLSHKSYTLHLLRSLNSVTISLRRPWNIPRNFLGSWGGLTMGQTFTNLRCCRGESVFSPVWTFPSSVCRKANIMVSILVDVALGLLLISWLYRDNHITMLANTLVPAADVSMCCLVQTTKCSGHLTYQSTRSYSQKFLPWFGRGMWRAKQ